MPQSFRTITNIVILSITAGTMSCGKENPASDDADGSTNAAADTVGFLSGEKKAGSVPDDGSFVEAPDITSLSLERARIAEGEPFVVTVGFSDDEGDVAGVNFGIREDNAFYILPFDDAAGETHGAVQLTLFPENYLPGHYVLSFSLFDAAGHIGAAAKVLGTILNPDGSVPEGASTHSPETDPDTETDTGSGVDKGTEGDSEDAPTDDDSQGDSETGPPEGGPTFLMGYQGDPSLDEPPAIVAVTPTENGPYIRVVTEIGPRFLEGDAHDYADRRLAFSASPEFWVDGKSPIAVLDIDAPEDLTWAPIPSDDTGASTYTVPVLRPQLLPTGGVVYQVSQSSVDTPDAPAVLRLAAWTPETDDLIVQEGLDALIQAQPEIEACLPDCGITRGTVDGTFAASPVENQVYFTLLGASEDAEAASTIPEHGYLARWDVETGETDILTYLGADATVLNLTGDGRFVVLVHEDVWKRYDIENGTLATFDEIPAYLEAGQTSPDSAYVVKGWAGCGDFGGISIYDLDADSGFQIIDAGLYRDFHKGVSNRVQLTSDGETIYFMAAADDCVTYKSEVVVMESPVTELNSDPETRFTLDPRYDFGIFILVE